MFVVVLVVSIAIVLALIEVQQTPAVRSYVIRSPQLWIRTPAWAIHYEPPRTVNNTVFGLLMEASQRLNFTVDYITYQVPQGVFVTSINGTRNGQDGLFWQYWVNGQIGPVAADHMAIGDGAEVLWNFTTAQAGA